MRASFLDFFPTPRYLASVPIGLDISDDTIKFLELKHVGGGLRLARYGEQLIPHGVLEGGEIKQPKTMEDVLRVLKRETGISCVSVALPEEQGYSLRLNVPVAHRAEVREGVELQLEEHVPLPLDEIVFDYEIVSGPSSIDAAFDVSVSVLPRALIAAYLDLFTASGFEPIAFEIEGQATARAVVSMAEQSTLMIVDFGRVRTGIAIVGDGFVWFSSAIPIGGEMLTHLIEKGLAVSHADAEQKKNSEGIVRTESNKGVFELLAPTLSALKDEINRHHLYWNSHKDQSGRNRKPIEKVVLCGGAANLNGLPDYLSFGLGLPVHLADPWVNVGSVDDCLPGMEYSRSLGYVTAIGLALRAFDATHRTQILL